MLGRIDPLAHGGEILADRQGCRLELEGNAVAQARPTTEKGHRIREALISRMIAFFPCRQLVLRGAPRLNSGRPFVTRFVVHSGFTLSLTMGSDVDVVKVHVVSGRRNHGRN
jgi:hypothetical protein